MPPRQTAYVAGLTMLARRELSEAQVRERLRRKGFDDDDIDEAVVRLRRDRAIDDQRVAEAIARTQISLRRRGPRRVAREIQRAGVAAPVARRAVASVYADVDADALLETALTARLRGHESIASRSELQRLYRYLTGQGFEPDRVMAVLRKRAAHRL